MDSSLDNYFQFYSILFSLLDEHPVRETTYAPLLAAAGSRRRIERFGTSQTQAGNSSDFF